MSDKYYGKYRATVVDTRDSEHTGKIEVKVPTIHGEQDTVTASAALPYGYFFVPEVNDNVWVEFEGGELRKPLWTGIQSVPGRWAREADLDTPDKRVLRSPTGHVIVLSDRGGEEGIEIRSNARIVIRALGTIELRAPNITINGRPVTPSPNPI